MGALGGPRLGGGGGPLPTPAMGGTPAGSSELRGPRGEARGQALGGGDSGSHIWVSNSLTSHFLRNVFLSRRKGAYAILFCVGKYRKAVAALGTRRPARTTTLSQSTAPLSPARKSAGCWNVRRTASVRQTDCAETRRTPAVRKRLRASPAAGSETASGLGKPDSGPRPRAAAPLRARLSAVRVVSAPARPPQAAATSGKSAPDSKSPPPAMTGPVGGEWATVWT